MVKSRFGNLDTDINLGGDNARDDIIASQKAVKTYIDNNKGGGTLEELSDVNINNPTQGQNLTYDATNNVWKNTSTTATVAWGGITGNIEDQSDLQGEFDKKQDVLTAGDNIQISGDIISATDTTYSTGTKTTAGITKLYDNLGENTDGALNQNAASNKLINYNTVNQELNSFNNGNKMYWLSSIHNAFYKADERYNTSWSGFSSGTLASLFNGNFENADNIVANGDIGKVTISRTGSFGGITGTYTQGFIYISFYYNRAPINLSQVTVKYKPKTSDTIKTATMEEVYRQTISRVSYIEVARCTIPAEGAQWVEITIDNTDGTEETIPYGISLNEVEFFERRPNGISDFPVVTKYTSSEIFGNLTASKFVMKGGTSSQFLKANGSVDSSTYQKTTDNNLTTTSKNIVGAINEVNAKPSGSVETDDVTINKNADDEIQAIGTIEKNASTVKYDWVGTLAEYEEQEIATLHPTWICYITDDIDVTGVSYGAGLTYSNNTLQLKDQNGQALGNSVEIEANPVLDEETITTNSSNELQAIALMDSGDNIARKERYVTQAQYEALRDAGTLDPNTYYNTPDNLTSSLLEILFPVGYIYLGDMSTCPLSALFGTWQALPSDTVIQIAGTRGSVGTTLNESLPNIKGDMNNKGLINQGEVQGSLTGAFYMASINGDYGNTTQGGENRWGLGFDASRSSLTYQDNAPVQPRARLTNGWIRIA